jgi:hypothetical protein
LEEEIQAKPEIQKPQHRQRRQRRKATRDKLLIFNEPDRRELDLKGNRVGHDERRKYLAKWTLHGKTWSIFDIGESGVLTKNNISKPIEVMTAMEFSDSLNTKRYHLPTTADQNYWQYGRTN